MSIPGKRIMVNILLAIILFFINSFLKFSAPRSIQFGYPFSVYRFPFDCAFAADPNYICEGYLYQGIVLNIIFWNMIAALIQFAFARRKVIVKTILKTLQNRFIQAIIVVVIFIWIILISRPTIHTYIRNTEETNYCGGFTGAQCPIGYICMDKPDYPDATGTCRFFVSALLFDR